LRTRANVRRAFVCEGESDRLALLQAGLESVTQANGTAVVAVPGAKNFDPSWAKLFAGREVILVFDDDDAGKAGAEKVAGILAPWAARVRVWDGGAQ